MNEWWEAGGGRNFHSFFDGLRTTTRAWGPLPDSGHMVSRKTTMEGLQWGREEIGEEFG